MNKIKPGNFIPSLTQVFNLYKFWDQKIIKDISDLDLFYLASALGENISQITLNKVDIQVGETAKDGLIYHPILFSSPQWVFIPSDKEYKQLQDFISESIN
jgi:hypothetical protein